MGLGPVFTTSDRDPLTTLMDMGFVWRCGPGTSETLFKRGSEVLLIRGRAERMHLAPVLLLQGQESTLCRRVIIAEWVGRP